ncbi:MAG: 2 protein [Patescibacteria group bacterium]|nr:2 protein [Patescibacteria group bacterium]
MAKIRKSWYNADSCMKVKIIILSMLVAVFALADAGFFAVSVRAEEDAQDVQEKLEKTIDKKEEVEQELSTAQTMLQKTQAQIGTTKNLLNKTESEMSRKEKEIENLEQRIELNKKILESYVQEMYMGGQDPLLGLVAGEKSINDMSENFDQILSIKEKVLLILEDIDQAKDELNGVKEELEEKKEDHEKLLSVQQGQQYEINSDIKEAQASLSELNAKINKLRGELSKLLGSAVSFKNVTDAASFAAKVTGIRKDYLLGVLVVESNLGRYTGGCNYKESRMSGARAETFKNICKELDYNYQKQKVSCPPSGYSGTGGAMGVAQFMPDTWVGYKSSIAAVTGHNPPDPWNLTDGVVAMALKLAKVDGVKQHKKSAEAKAYCIYLAGGNWAAYCDSKGVNYGEKVLYWADNYEKMMD